MPFLYACAQYKMVFLFEIWVGRAHETTNQAEVA